jgi:hypothetical protein
MISHSVVLKKCWSEEGDVHTIVIQREDGTPVTYEEILLLLKQYITLIERPEGNLRTAN